MIVSQDNEFGIWSSIKYQRLFEKRTEEKSRHTRLPSLSSRVTAPANVCSSTLLMEVRRLAEAARATKLIRASCTPGSALLEESLAVTDALSDALFALASAGAAASVVMRSV